ncbi:MAG: VWA domain-containing protein, partial [Chloroflexi bacterium]
FALFLLALTSLVIALVRPVTITSIPVDQATIIMAIDVSLSMRSNDIPPSRLEAAEAAAISFIRRQKPGTQIGIVAFAGFAELVQPPTDDQEDLQSAVENLMLARRTAIGSGILKSLDAIAEVDSSIAPTVSEAIPNTGKPTQTPVPRGVYAPHIIVLLTDGVSNSGPQPLEAASQAVDRGVRIYTIGFGTDNGTIPFSGQPSQNDPFGGGFRMGIDEDTLKQIASMTGGKYYSASSAGELQTVFQRLPTSLITRNETTEISVFFTAIAALFAALAVTLALLWNPLT